MSVMFRGKPACECLAAWLPVYEAELLRRGIIKVCIDIYQLIGLATKSANTHWPGGAYDIAQISDESVRVAREMGAIAWPRPYNWDGDKGVAHQHGLLRGCPHITGYVAKNQITAYDAGYNGLGHLGRGGPDTGPKVASRRTWREGIRWAKDHAAKREIVNVVVANVCSLPRMTDNEVAADLRKIRALRPHVVFGSEIEPATYKDLWNRIIGGDGGKTYGLLHECPIWLGSRWRVTASKVKRRVLGSLGISPTRWDTIVEAQRRGGFPLAFIAMHTYSQKDDPTASRHRLRRRKWNRHIKRTAADIAKLNARGVSVLVGGDLNDHKGPTRFTANQINLADEGLLQLTLCPAPGVTGSLKGIHRLKGNTDHPILGIRVALKEVV